MKRILFALLLLTAGCTSLDAQYREARGKAAEQPFKSSDLGFGFRTGMTKQETEARLAKLEGTIEAGIRLPITGWQDAEIKPGYANEKLVLLQIRLKSASQSEVAYNELVRLLNTRYGAPSYPHEGLGGSKAHSWFNGPIEIEAGYDEILGLELEYTDLTHEREYIDESIEEFDREQKAQKAQQKQEADRL